jgi:hypothetical protein
MKIILDKGLSDYSKIIFVIKRTELTLNLNQLNFVSSILSIFSLAEQTKLIPTDRFPVGKFRGFRSPEIPISRAVAMV